MSDQQDLKLFRFSFLTMGSPAEIQLYAPNHTRANQIAQQAIAEANRLEQRYSRYRADSVLSAINQVAAVGGNIRVDAETASLLDYAAACYHQSDGLFDITSGLLRQAWDFRIQQLPKPDLIQSLLQRIGWHKLQWESPQLTFSTGMELDLGGIVKEYAADRLATLCWNAGAEHGFVNLGGDIRVFGPHPNGNPWHIGIKQPPHLAKTSLQSTSQTLRTIHIHRGGIASSGDYERGITLNGQRYSHILNPKTGWPVQHMAAVTVVADFCVLAGSVATIGMLKQQEGAAWLETLGLRHLWVDTEGRCGDFLD